MLLSSLDDVRTHCLVYEDIDGKGVFDSLTWQMDESEFICAWVSRETSVDDSIYEFHVYTKKYVYVYNKHLTGDYCCMDVNPWTGAPRNP